MIFFKRISIPLAVFLLAFVLVPFRQLQGFAMMPGDIGDARLNNYFLENIFLFLSGKVDSLWQLPFFYPFPYVLGFSDNHFGSGLAYILPRIFGLEPDTSFQVWFLFAYAVNFSAAYYALRNLGGSIIAASIGGLIFAFSLPTTSHAAHAQLHYRFALPLAIVFFANFLSYKNWLNLLISGAWLVWQFYSGIYMGFFTFLLMAAMFFSYIGNTIINKHIFFKDVFSEFCDGWIGLSRRQKYLILSGVASLILLLMILFYPYLQVTHMYGARRSWSEIALMLPRMQSYLLSDASALWSNPASSLFSSLPMRHEHQMFFGAMPIFLALLGLVFGRQEKNRANYALMSGMVFVTFFLTIYVGGYSLWYLLHKLPLASAIRAMTRMDQALLFPIAYFAVIAIDSLRKRIAWSYAVTIILVLSLIIFESAMTAMATSTKDSWRDRQKSLAHLVPSNLASDAILFVSQKSGPVIDDIDAMWLALGRGIKTLNGYSGLFPPSFRYDYGDDCSEIPRRIFAYLTFIGRTHDLDAYRALMSRVVAVGFGSCNPAWLNALPNVTESGRIYTSDEFRNLTLVSAKLIAHGDGKTIFLKVNNSSSEAFAARSLVYAPILISWRFLDEAKQPLSGWDSRKELPFDIPPKGFIDVSFGLKLITVQSAKFVQISLVQEQVFWWHDLGMMPIILSLN